MPLAPDDTVCFCFHVPLRKVEAFCRRERPAAASQISECLSAGTGCGWCIPLLRRIHEATCGDAQAAPELPDPQQHAAGRKEYLQRTGRQPPPDADA
jgi:bacterioferritin-associated ferredoxin